MIKCIEPTENVRIYFDDADKGRYFTASVYGMAMPSDQMLFKDKQEQTKMTREEAEKIVVLKGYGIGTDSLFAGRGLPPEKEFLNTLEALGLIKFDEQKFVTLPHCGGIDRNSATVAIDDMKIALGALGYKVTKI